MCLRWLFNRNKYQLVTNDYIEMSDPFPVLENIITCWYICGNDIDKRKRLNVDQIKFYDDSLGFNKDLRLKYELVASYRVVDKTLMILTFTNYKDSQFQKCDQISAFILKFDNKTYISEFRNLFHKKVLEYKKIGTFDKDVMKFKSFKRVFDRF